jgi:hypothetical protein
MGLVTTADVLTALKMTAAPGTSAYQQIDLLRRQFESIIKRWLKWPVEANDGMGYGNFLEYYDGKGYMDVVLRNPWVARVSQVLLTQLGAYGSYNQGFSQATALTNGTDYSLVFEQNKLCRSGILRRLTNNLVNIGWWPAMQIYNQNPGGLAYQRGPFWPGGFGNIRVTYDWGFQPSTAPSAGSWTGGVATLTFPSAIVVRPTDQFTIKDAVPAAWNGDWQVATVSDDSTQVTFRTATDPGALSTVGTATFIPLDIQAAVCEAVSIGRAMMQYGGKLGNENLGDYGYGLVFNREDSFGTVRQMLSPWRDMSAGIALG